jgi:hypothetical protein
MMGRQTRDQSQLFYLFNLEGRIPAGHLLRRMNPVVTGVLADLREKLASFYSDIGRPSIDPELMIRMLIVGYCYGIRFERRLCEEVELHLKPKCTPNMTFRKIPRDVHEDARDASWTGRGRGYRPRVFRVRSTLAAGSVGATCVMVPNRRSRGCAAILIGWAHNHRQKSPAISGGADLSSNEPSGRQEISHPHDRDRGAGILIVFRHTGRAGPNVTLFHCELHARTLVDLKLAF